MGFLSKIVGFFKEETGPKGGHFHRSKKGTKVYDGGRTPVAKPTKAVSKPTPKPKTKDTFGQRVIHSHTPISSIKSVSVDQQRGVHLKPVGIWYSNGAWAQHAKSEGMPLGKHAQHVTIDHSKVLKINTPKDLADFHQKYGVITGVPGDKMGMVDWKKVAKDHHGIEIKDPRGLYKSTGHTEEAREARALWLHGFDVASGVVWHKDAIKLDAPKTKRATKADVQKAEVKEKIKEAIGVKKPVPRDPHGLAKLGQVPSAPFHSPTAKVQPSAPPVLRVPPQTAPAHDGHIKYGKEALEKLSGTKMRTMTETRHDEPSAKSRETVEVLPTGSTTNRGGARTLIHSNSEEHQKIAQAMLDKSGLMKLIGKHDILDTYVHNAAPWRTSERAIGHAPTQYMERTQSLAMRIWAFDNPSRPAVSWVEAHKQGGSFTVVPPHGLSKGDEHHDPTKQPTTADHVAYTVLHEAGHHIEAIYGMKADGNLGHIGAHFREKEAAHDKDMADYRAGKVKKLSTKGEFVSEYARANRGEWFAETHAQYCLAPEFLKTYHPEDHAVIQRVRKELGLE